MQLTVYEGGSSTPAEAVQLFASAVAVVAVHGAALASTLFCRPGTLVVELGLRAPVARHFAHAAAGQRTFALVCVCAYPCVSDLAHVAKKTMRVAFARPSARPGLGLHYRWVPLEVDERSVGAEWVQMAERALEDLLDVVDQYLRGLGHIF